MAKDSDLRMSTLSPTVVTLHSRSIPSYAAEVHADVTPADWTMVSMPERIARQASMTAAPGVLALLLGAAAGMF